MIQKKLPFISSVQLAKIDGKHVIPTVLFYESKRPIIGYEAKERCPSAEFLVEDFKIELGLLDPDRIPNKSALSENTPRRTSAGLAKDFFDTAIKKINTWLDVQGLALPTRILIAEPLSLSGTDTASEAWLANYRKSIKKMLHGKFKEIDFMPEPFAVFQYYRYGLRHPVVAEHRKHVALVLDFGGGTFDVSVIETTKTGDISGGGVNSRPLGAKSAQVGGFYINRLIAEDLLFPVLANQVDKSDVRKALLQFYENKNADEDFIASLSESRRSFFRAMKTLLQDVERAKISICNSIANWSLSANLNGISPYSISIPTNPFSEASPRASAKLDAAKLQRIYTDQIWGQKLKDTVTKTIERARADTSGQDISIVLLSGGSSNIRWLRPLLERDMKKYLQNAQILELSENFSEIVAKGLATECARRHYTGGQGDFRAVTYNRLCLLMKSDDGILEARRLRPISESLLSRYDSDTGIDDGVLLPASSSLRGLIDQPLRWKVKLAKPPKHILSYYFMRSSFDPEDLDARHNLIDTRVTTPAGTQFNQSIEVELTVREDGTAEPKFNYGRDNVRQGTSASGKPFFIDMTFASDEVQGETYLGFDFGTSTSACSFVSSSDIQWIEARSKNSGWMELSDLVSELPYPAAAPLAKFISEKDQKVSNEKGREAVEAMLTLIAYTTYSELCASSKPTTSHFKNLPHRSAGPLWGLIRSTIKAGGGKLPLGQVFSSLLEQHEQQINNWIADINDTKHGKGSRVDYISFLLLLGNTIAKAFIEHRFGVFEQVTSKRFSQQSFKGLFRCLTGSSQTFIHVLEYEGGRSFSDGDVFIVSPNEGSALNLSPLYLVGLNTIELDDRDPDLFEYDNDRQSVFSFKSVQQGKEFLISSRSQLPEIALELEQMRKADQPREVITDLSFVDQTGTDM